MPSIASPAARAAAEMELRRRRTGNLGTFADFVRRRNRRPADAPSLLSYEHVPRLVGIGQRVADGELARVLIIMPPRYFKSEVFSRLLPAYYLRRHPSKWVGLGSYSANLAWELSENARSAYLEDGGALHRSTHAKRLWHTRDGGGMWADGLKGSQLGLGYHVGVVDDPMKPEHAHSRLWTRAFERWWPEKFLSRREPGAALVFVMQRLGVEDPVDFLFRREVGERTDHAPEHWHVVCCDELKSDEPLGRWDGPMGLPPTCSLEPDPREKGEPLAPSRFSAEQVEDSQRSAGDTVRRSQRQQRPAAPEGDFWKREWFLNVYDDLPADAHMGGRDWDTAFTKDEANSASAWVETYRGPGPADACRIYLHDFDWRWLEFPGLVDWMRSLEGPHYVEQKASGKSAAQTLRSEGVAVFEVPVAGGKFERANAVQRVVSSGRAWVRRAVLHRFLEGARQGLLRVNTENLMTNTGDLDLNDAFVQALHRHTRVAQSSTEFFTF